MHSKKFKSIAISVLATTLMAAASQAAPWNSISVPSLSSDYFTVAFGNLPDGRAVYGEHGNLYLQDSWDSSTFNAFANEPSPSDPSFIAVYDNSSSAMGQGGWGSSGVYSFDPDSTGSSFTSAGVTIQNYDGVMRDANSLFTAGTDTGASNNHHGVRFVTLDGSTNKIVIDDVSTYSCGIAIHGDELYVGDNDNGDIYKFAKAVLDSAIAGDPLSVTDGEFVANFGSGGNISSIAVDANGVIWGAGWAHSGLKSYDPVADNWGSFIPRLDNTNYKVGTFSRNSTNYVGYLNSESSGSFGPLQGDEVYYGYADADMVPEPQSLLLLGLGTIVVAVRKIRKVRGDYQDS